MADLPQAKTPEEIEKELTVGKFAGQQARTLGLSFGGMALGGLAGWALATKTSVGAKLAKAFVGKAVAQAAEMKIDIGAVNEMKEAKQLGDGILTVTGATLGSAVGGVVPAYEHWAKVKRQELEVKETHGAAHKMLENRIKLEKTIDSQHDIIQKLLKERKPSNDGQQFQNDLARRELADNAGPSK